MKNQMNINFTSKFQLLNSQEHNEEIIWSCSDSSDYEVTHKENSLNISNKIFNRKRKRTNKKTIKISNLDINFTDTQDLFKNSEKYNISKSPILSHGTVKNKITSSPIILLKHDSSLPAAKIKKKLFETNLKQCGKSNSESSVIFCTPNYESKSNFISTIGSPSKQTNCFNTEKRHEIKSASNQKLRAKDKSYFDSHFSSQSSQHSISECDTDSLRSNEVEIISSLTPTIMPIKIEPTSSSDTLSSDQEIMTKSKKARYKRNGLSYRLNSLLKKQNASVSLWHHEKFLAVNSNFVIPREEFIAFQIQNITSKYGSFLLESIDSDSKRYLILINNMYLNNNILKQNAIFKLYKPFRVIDFDIHYKLVVNVCRFECTGMIS